MMSNLATKLLRTEGELNSLQSDTFQLGSANSDYFRLIYMNSNVLRNSYLKNIGELVVFLFKFLVSKKIKFEFNNVKVLFGKSGQKKHHNRLMDYLQDAFEVDVHFFDKNYKEAFGCLTTGDKISITLKSLRSLRRYYRLVKKISVKNDVNFYPSLLITHCTIQLVKFRSCLIFLKKVESLKALVVDFDRSSFSALVLAAKSLEINTVSFQHGAINPPFGYNPLIAKEIWVWGKTWSECLIRMGVDESKIRIVGSTISEKAFKMTRKTDEVKVIGIGPNPIGFDENYALWNELIKKLLYLEYEVIVKLHPSMKADAKSRQIFEEKSKLYEYNEMQNEDFFNTIDLLIVSNSGLGYEAVLADVAVAVIRQKGSKGNDHIMISTGNFPEVEANSYLSQKISEIEQDYFSILEREKAFIENNIYAKVGLEARNETIRLINQYL